MYFTQNSPLFFIQNIYTHFAKNVNDYDTVANKVVMKNDELHEALIDAIPFKKEQKLNILDLGSGTGHSMLLVLKKFPKAKITGIDFSSKMILKSGKNLSKFANRIKLIEKNFNKIDFGKNYDAIISAIAIHNSTHKEKKVLFAKIYGSLKKGGVFINGDFIEGEDSKINKHYQEIYRSYMKKNLSEHELKAWLHHAFKEDMPLVLSRQFSLLKSAGLKEITLLWQFNNEAVYIAKKS